MNERKPSTKDPICGMNVDKATAPHVEQEGKSYYFCSDKCKQKFLSNAAVKAEGKSGSCCGGCS